MTSGGATPPPPKLSPGSSLQPAVSSPLSGNAVAANERARRRTSHPSHALLRPSPSPRSQQSLRKQHKARRPHLEDEDAMAEAAAIRSASSRRGQTSITHLMKFALPPRPPVNDHGLPRRPHRQAPLHSRVDKARHVHANYRFVVDPRSSSYSGHIDEGVDWDSVLQVLASAQQQSRSCPICLCSPVAPRMAKCGHIFCLHCLIRYIHTANDSKNVSDRRSRWSTCPICWDVIYMSDTRSIRWIQEQVDQPHEGSDVVLRLMIRNPGRSLALPRDAADALEQDIPWSHAAEVLDFARVMKGDPEYMVAQFDQEIEEVLAQEREDEVNYGEGKLWTQKAIVAIREARERTEDVVTARDDDGRSIDKNISLRTAAPNKQSGLGSSQLTLRGKRTETVTSGSPRSHPSTGSAANSRRLSNARHPVTRPSAASSPRPYFFYQLLPTYFLAPLDIRILLAAFGDYASFPTTILPRVENVSMGHVVDEEMRRRAKYLAHMPLGSEVSFLECDMTDIVPAAILQRFASDLEERRKKNRDKKAQEEKARTRAEKEESRKWHMARPRRDTSRSIEDDSALPSDFMPPSSEAPEWPSRSTQDGSAFAMLASPSTSPDTHRTVWGTPAVAASPPALEAKEIQPIEEEEDGWLRGWEDDGGLLYDMPPSVQAEVTSKKKGKHKRVTLMSTSARRAA